MVDVSGKAVTGRRAVAAGRLQTTDEVVGLLRRDGLPKGDALAVARLAGIMGAKRTPDLIPLCHPIALHGVTVDLALTGTTVEITATVRTADRTGVEMEALTAVATAGLALIDMVKAVDPAASHRARTGAAQGRRQDRRLDPTGGPLVIRARVIVASNRAAAGVYADTSGPLLVAGLRELGCEVDEPVVVPDGEPVGGGAARRPLADGIDVVLTSGGTGVTPTDRTPEVTRALLDYEIPGIAEAIRAHSRDAGADRRAVPRAGRRRRPDARGQPARLDRRRARTGSPCSGRSSRTPSTSSAAATTRSRTDRSRRRASASRTGWRGDGDHAGGARR